jgi:hypothetical protein
VDLRHRRHIDYTAEIVEYEEQTFNNKRERKVKRIQDKYPVLVDDLPLPASRKLSAVFSKLIPTFDLKSLQPYDPRYLASWLAEIYDVPMAEASLEARSQAFNTLKRDLPSLLGGINIVHTSSANMLVTSFKLNLLPVWMTEIPSAGASISCSSTGKADMSPATCPKRTMKTKAACSVFWRICWGSDGRCIVDVSPACRVPCSPATSPPKILATNHRRVFQRYNWRA